VFTRGDRRRNCRRDRLRRPIAPTIASCIHFEQPVAPTVARIKHVWFLAIVAPTIASCIHYEQPVAATMQITANHVVLRNDVDVIANDQFCWVGYKIAMWSEEETLKLINIMKQFPVLWQAIISSTGKKGRVTRRCRKLPLNLVIEVTEWTIVSQHTAANVCLLLVRTGIIVYEALLQRLVF